tara:strand:- start:143 stop:385 length:243 start_codon:yes stop_codon:yes gene_type:complete
MKNNLIKYLLYLLIFDLLIITKNAYAYLDPGTITAFIQLLIAGIAGALLTVKLWWLSFKNFIINIFKSKKSDNDKENENN